MDDVSIIVYIGIHTSFHTGFFLEEGNVDVCKGCMYPLDFNKILDIFKDKKRQIQL